MPKDFARTERVSPLIQTSVARIISEEIFEPWVKLLTITGVDVSRNFSVAKIYVSVMSDDQKEIDDVISKLNTEAKGLRYRLSKQVNMRTTPELRFVFDASISEGRRLSDLLNRLD